VIAKSKEWGGILTDNDDLKVCHRCVGESFLRSYIEREGEVDKCGYCGREGERCIPIEELADEIGGAFERHYYRTSDQPDEFESMLLRDRESSYDWDRHGEPVLSAIADAASIEDDIAQDVLNLLEDQYSDLEMAQMGEECEFAAESCYEWKDANDYEFASEFAAIERSLKSEARFFNRGAEAFLERLFGNVDGLADREGRPVIVTAGPESEIRGFYRARVFHKSDELEAAMVRPDLHLGPPPGRTARAGRMNAHGVSVFYGASDSSVALAEVRPPVGSRAIIAHFELVRPVRLLDVEALRSVYFDGSIFDAAYLEQLVLVKFLGRLSDRVTMPVMPDDEPTEYLITQMIADYLAQRSVPGLDGILFPSIQCPGEHRNVVLFHHASRVLAMQFSEGTELTARQYENTEDGPEPDYCVWEEVPEQSQDADKEQTNDGDALCFAEMLRPQMYPHDDGDAREESLRVNIETIAVHHVKSVTFGAETFSVQWVRLEKQNPLF
tara:strand:+ start:1263 stop:2756 length:1494 start_codon:yes stop_codon:yes gene_type:complete